jgi:hypothetical protein
MLISSSGRRPSDLELRENVTFEEIGMLLQHRVHLVHDELIHLGGRAANEFMWVGEGLQLGISGDTAEQVVLGAFHLDTSSSLHAVLADDLVQVLAVATLLHVGREDESERQARKGVAHEREGECDTKIQCTNLDAFHKDVLGRHEWELRHDVLADDERPDLDPVDDVRYDVKNSVHGQEPVRQYLLF